LFTEKFYVLEVSKKNVTKTGFPVLKWGGVINHATGVKDLRLPSALRVPRFFTCAGRFLLKWGIFCLTLPVKMGYNVLMFASIVFFVLRIGLITALWAFIWRFVEPRTQLMRILRAALLLLAFWGVLAVLRITGQ